MRCARVSLGVCECLCEWLCLCVCSCDCLLSLELVACCGLNLGCFIGRLLYEKRDLLIALTSSASLAFLISFGI